MKKNIIITVITLAVIAIVVAATNEALNICKIYNAQCEMYNKLCDSKVCQIDSLVRTFPQDHIVLIMGEDGKVSEVKVPNDINGIETIINGTIGINNHCDNMLNNINELDKLKTNVPITSFKNKYKEIKTSKIGRHLLLNNN